MELLIYLAAVFAVGLFSFWLLGFLYGICRRPAVYFPLSLALKMNLAGLLGAVVLGFGGIVAATAIFVLEFRKRDDFVMWKGIMTGALISTVCSVWLLYVAYILAWSILE